MVVQVEASWEASLPDQIAAETETEELAPAHWAPDPEVRVGRAGRRDRPGTPLAPGSPADLRRSATVRDRR